MRSIKSPNSIKTCIKIKKVISIQILDFLKSHDSIVDLNITILIEKIFLSKYNLYFKNIRFTKINTPNHNPCSKVTDIDSCLKCIDSKQKSLEKITYNEYFKNLKFIHMMSKKFVYCTSNLAPQCLNLF